MCHDSRFMDLLHINKSRNLSLIGMKNATAKNIPQSFGMDLEPCNNYARLLISPIMGQSYFSTNNLVL